MGLTKATSEERHFPYEPYISAHSYYLCILACRCTVSLSQRSKESLVFIGSSWASIGTQQGFSSLPTEQFFTRNIKLLQPSFRWFTSLNQPMQIKVQFQNVEIFLATVNLILPYLACAVKLCNHFYPLNLQHL